MLPAKHLFSFPSVSIDCLQAKKKPLPSSAVQWRQLTPPPGSPARVRTGPRAAGDSVELHSSAENSVRTDKTLTESFVCLTKTDGRRRSCTLLCCAFERKLLHFMPPHNAWRSPIMHSSCDSLYLSVSPRQDCDNILGLMTKEILKKKRNICIL